MASLSLEDIFTIMNSGRGGQSSEKESGPKKDSKNAANRTSKIPI
jgi:hypothetical protein